MLVPPFTVTENVMLGHERTHAAGFLDRRRARSHVLDISRRFGLDVPPDAVVEDLPVGVRQRVEILKALSHDARLLVLDEPTAVLSPGETDRLMDVMRALSDAGTSIVFISHKLREVREVADRITVIRRGAVTGSAEPTASEEALASMMVGRPVRLTVEREPAVPGEVVLAVRGVTLVDERGIKRLSDVDLSVRAGEICAIAGVQGNGQTELAQALVGLARPAHGSIRIAGCEATSLSTGEILGLGVGYVPEDRLHDGVVTEFSVAENLVLDLHDKPPYARRGVLVPERIADNAARQVTDFDVRPADTTAAAGTLSGGNQQKVVLARELSRPLKLLIVAQPTRGLDVGSMESIHRRIVAARDEGAAVVLISTELDEVLGLADRVAVMSQGRIAGEVPAGTPAERIGMLMAGAPTPDSPHAADVPVDRAKQAGVR
jgi:general nucleoside transport system ATP-binding protein